MKDFFTKDGFKTVVLVDPDRFDETDIEGFKEKINRISVSMFFVGGSFISRGNTEKTVRFLKKHFSMPVLLFPGDYAQLTPVADAVLFLTLLSGRNSEYLVGQQVKAAPLIKRWQMPVVSVAYLLIDGGRLSTVQYITQTVPLPQDKPELVVATALAGQFMGMDAVYLEAGSGADIPVSLEIVRRVSKAVDIPVIVGGGIRDFSLLEMYREAGASAAVIGTWFE